MQSNYWINQLVKNEMGTILIIFHLIGNILWSSIINGAFILSIFE